MQTGGLAHEVVNRAIDLGLQTADWGKSKSGILKAVIERVEGPVKVTLGTTAAKTVIKVGDSVLTTVDKSIESTMNTSYYKSGEAFIKSQYSNRIVPATNTVTTTVATTTTRITTPVINTYTNVLTFADRQVEYYIPDAEGMGKELPLSVMGITKKATRRSLKKVGQAKKRAVTKIGNMANVTQKSLKFAYEQAKPSNIKKNTIKLIGDAKKRTVKLIEDGFQTSDKLIDRFLPAKGDALVAKGPVTLVNKVSNRVLMHTLAHVRATATAVKNSPSTFKRAVNNTWVGTKIQLARLRTMSVDIRYKSYDTLLPYINAAHTRSLAIIQATDRLLLKYPLTTYFRNFAVKRYDTLVAPVVNKLIKAAPAPAPAPKKEVLAVELEHVPAQVSTSTEQDVIVPPAEEEEEKVQEPEKTDDEEEEQSEEAAASMETEDIAPASVVSETVNKKKAKRNKKRDAAAFC